jgi:hypothetical protein
MNTSSSSITDKVNDVVKEDDGPTIAYAAMATLNPNPITAEPTASVETKEEEEPTYLRDDIARKRAEFFAGPEAMHMAIPSETSTMVTAATVPNNEVIILDETDAMDCIIVNESDTKPIDSSAGEPIDLTSGEPMENAWTDETEHAREVSEEEITTTSSATTQAGRSYDDNYDPAGEFSDGDCP